MNEWQPYKREYNPDGTEKHITKQGARYHVISYVGGAKGARQVCSEPNCEINRRQESTKPERRV